MTITSQAAAPGDVRAPDAAPLRVPFDNSYARLPARFHVRLDPTPVAAPRLVRVNTPLAELLGLDPAALAGPEGVAVLAGNRVPDGAEPIAMAYAGHQFGGFVPQLGDGRAILLGEVVGATGSDATSSSRAPARRPSRAARMGARRSGPCCANTS
jgi:uncharacterized protein YdiU (UPF0061 family)